MDKKNSQNQEEKGSQGMDSTLKNLGYENCFKKEVFVWIDEDCDDDDFGSIRGYALYEKIIVIDGQIFIMGFAHEGAREVQQELEVLKKVLLKEYEIITIHRVNEFPSHYFEFRNEAIKEEFCNPY